MHYPPVHGSPVAPTVELANGLLGNAVLRVFSPGMSGDMTEVAGIALASALGANTTLKTFKLMVDGVVWEAAGDALVSAAGANSTLQSLSFTARAISPYLNDRFVDAFRANAVLKHIDYVCPLVKT